MAADQGIYLIIDGSGSMSGQKNEVQKGVNDFIDEQKADVAQTGDTVEFSLTVFDSNVKPVYISEDLTLVNPIRVSDIFLGGGTALLDAIGKTLTNAEDDKINKHIVVIYTDGEENQSREFTHEQISALIEKLEKTGKWQFVFLGAELQDFRKNTASVGIRGSGQILNTSKSKVGQTFDSLSHSTSYYRSATADQVQNIVDEGLIASTTKAGIDWDSAKVDDPQESYVSPQPPGPGTRRPK